MARYPRFARILAAIVVFLPVAFGQATAAATTCESLRRLTGFEFTVATAQTIPAQGDAPRYCRVTGLIQPEIRFEVFLPGEWNRRFLMRGNGGYAGVLDKTGPVKSVQAGYAVAVTDTGHDARLEPLGTFAVNRQKLYDFAFRSLHTTAVAAKKIIAEYYGSQPAHSYFVGCSTGGRQALILAQRFPEDFDGIISGAPVLDWTGTMLQFASNTKAMKAAPVPSSKVRLLAEKIYQGCDAKDGLEDGVIDDPRRCNFSASRDLPVCSGGEDRPECFTPAQIGALETVYGPLKAAGVTLMDGWPVGAEIAGANGRSGWHNWIVNDDGPTIAMNFSQSFLRYMAFEEKDPKFEVSELDLDRQSPLVDWLRPVIDAKDPDLSAFHARGGKLIMYYGWADPALNAMMGMRYVENVFRTMAAKTDSFFRYYLVPGRFHCGGGVGCGSFDMIPPLIGWVEDGKAPQSIVSAKEVEGKTVRTRPLCPYPQVARSRAPAAPTRRPTSRACWKASDVIHREHPKER